jgi:hypothetical protein
LLTFFSCQFDAWDANENGVWDRAELTTMVAAIAKQERAAFEGHHSVESFLRQVSSTGDQTQIYRDEFVNFFEIKAPSKTAEDLGQVRVTLASPSTAALTWVADVPDDVLTCAQWCVTSSCEDFIATTWNYTVPPRWWDESGSGYATFHGVIVPTKAGATINYGVGQISQGVCVTTFQSMVSIPDPTSETRVALVGDHGTYQLFGFATTDLMIAQFPEWNPSAVFILGMYK